MAASREQIEALIASLEAQGPQHLAAFLGQAAYGNLQGSAVRRPDQNVFALLRAHPEKFAALVEQMKPGYFERQKTDTIQNGGTVGLTGDPFATPAQRMPQNIAHYQIKKELGRGAMGVVYSAHDTKHDRDVALKMILAPDLEATLRFEQELKNLARVNHPNILQIYDSGKNERGQQYIVTEFIEGGQTLKDVLPNLSFAQDKHVLTARIFQQIAEGLGHAHERGVLHRDVKPANILVTPDKTPKVSDFGLAKNMQKPSGLTLDGDILGTPQYMSPEQVLGNNSEMGSQSDVYSLGVMLYQALTGSVPFDGRQGFPALANDITHTEPPAPRTVDKSIPKTLETITLKAMSKNKEERYENGNELAEALGNYIDGEMSRRVRNKVAKRGSAFGAVLLTLLGGFAGLQSYRAQGLELDATKAREGQIAAEAAAAKTRSDAESDRQNREYNLLISQAREAANAKRWDEADRRMQAARALRPTNMTPDVRQLEAVIHGDIPVTIAPINSNPIFWQISEMTRNGEVPVANSRSTGPQNVTLKRGHFYNLEAAPEGRMDYRHLFRMDDQTRITLRSEPRIQGQVVVNGRARPLPEFYLIANDTRDFYFSAVPTSIGQYVLFLNDKGIDVRDRTNALRPSFLSNNPALPLTQMNLAQANAYCTWLTEKLADAGMIGYRARLPTPREVELAAAPHSGWTYPWGYDVNPTNNDGTITNVYDAATLQRALETNDVASLLRPLTISDNLLGVAASRAKHWGNIRRLASEDGRVYAVGASFMENDESLHQFRRDNQGTWLYRRQMTDNQPDAATGFSVVIEKQ